MGLSRHEGKSRMEMMLRMNYGKIIQEETMYLDPEFLIVTREIGAEEEEKELTIALMAIDDEEEDEVEVESILTMRALFVAED